MFQRILIARRGESAARVARTCKRMGIEAVALFAADGDGGVHVQACDESTLVEGDVVSSDDLLAAAAAHKVDAVYPGYASQRGTVELARALEANGIPCVGADPDVLSTLTDRAVVAELLSEVGCRVLPGAKVKDLADAEGFAYQHGYPVVLRGLSTADATYCWADDAEELAEAFEKSDSETERWIEKGLSCPRRIDVVMAADSVGEVVALGELERSISAVEEGVRHHLISESPSPVMCFRYDGEAIRLAMFEISIGICKKLATVGLIVVEMLLDEHTNIYVQGVHIGLPAMHAPLEMVNGHDLVELQLRLAFGEELPAKTATLQIDGHAIGASVRALSAVDEKISAVRWPPMPQRAARVEASVSAGSAVPADDTPLLMKMTCFAPIRHQALLQLDRLLAATTVAPVEANVPLLRKLLAMETFRAGQYDTTLVDRVS